ncbi:MAG: hemolysin III family protein [Gemmatimonadetes bacterium]|nr:hemolysin III family protein [Gemmatimonadota bacterium]MCH7489269.1 hemolysin III family protein [Gemmatimonadota bacterium]
MPARLQTLGEEVANSVSHGIGFLAAVAVTPFLVVAAIPHGAGSIVGVSIFAATMAALYLASTLYHALPGTRAKRVFRVLDHGAIFLLIAGTYTPFTLGILRGGWGWALFGTIWGLALAGVIFNVVAAFRHPIISLAIYVAMGWLMLIAVQPLWQRMPHQGLLWLLAGGIAYTGGVAFYTAKRVRYSHFAWHLCVLAGTTCHFFAVIWYAA